MKPANSNQAAIETQTKRGRYPGLFVCAVLLYLSPVFVFAADFVTTWKTDNPGTTDDDQITIPTTGAIYNYTVDWGDGTQDAGVTGPITHTYAMPGTYTVSISGVFPRIHVVSSGQAEKILSVEQWGDIVWSSMVNAFFLSPNLVVNATDAPDLTNVTDLRNMFRGTAIGSPDFSNWDTSNVILMSNMFTDTNFNGDITSWETNNVESMSGMFLRAPLFNQDISAIMGTGIWDTSKVTNMSQMFQNASSFNGDINGWEVDNVELMSFMFANAPAFNQDINGWDVGNVTTMEAMFLGALMFNQDLNDWDTARVMNMRAMFQQAVAFNGDITDWDTGMVTDMARMFFLASVFNQDISFKGGNVWNTANVEDMSFMFRDALAFDQDIGGWDVGMVENMLQMFLRATSFNQDLNDWETGMVTNMNQMFQDAEVFNGDITDWDTGMVETMRNMFTRAFAFDQDLGGWDVTSLNDATNMFLRATLSTANYDSLLIGWNSQSLINDVPFHGGFSTYCLGEAARDNMIASDGWTVIDGGLQCPNAAPTDIAIDGANTDSINENSPSGTTIGELTSVDADPGDSHTYSLTCAVPGADDALFQISAANLQTNSVFDFENPTDANTDGTYEVCIVTTDDGDPAESYEEIITITINNQQPDLIINKTVSDPEPEVGSTITFTLNINNTGPDDATDIVINDLIPSGFTYAGSIAGGSSQDDATPDSGSGLEWTISSLAAGAPTVSLTFTATVNTP